MKFTLKNSFIRAAFILFTLLVPIVLSTASTQAGSQGSGGGKKSSATDPGLQKILDQQICPDLAQIHGEKLSGLCQDYATQTDLTNAVNKICGKYGGNGGQLQGDCQAYATQAAEDKSGPGGGPSGPGGAPTCNYSDGLTACCQSNNAANCDYGDENGDSAASANCSASACDLVATYINPMINVLSGLVGLVVVASLIAGGIQYSASEGDPQKSAKAKHRISNTLFALIAYFFLYAFLEFLIPGGTFNHI